ncbi:MAG: pYEATS domain-containing protein [Devosia sp.]
MSELVDLLTGLAWPALIVGGVWYFRDYVRSALDAVKRQFASGANLKWKDFEFTGINLAEFNKTGLVGYKTELATPEMLAARDKHYEQHKRLFLVHRVQPTGGLHHHNGLPTFDVMIKLLPHKNYGKLNDVKRVEYYLGHYFGEPKSEFGTKYVVENGSDGFAIRIDAYGPTLCEAVVQFHDGSSVTCSRYLDFEGTNYAYDPIVAQKHDDKVRVAKKAKALP